jgi:hypothetical protein
MNGYSVQLYNRDFSQILRPYTLAFTAEKVSFSAIGGPLEATIKAAGPIIELWEMIERLRCPIEVIAPNKSMVWWGFIEAVTIETKKISVSVSLEQMSNRVCVTYAEVNVAGAIGERKTTTWYENADSIATYGTKERRLSKSQATQSEAENYAQTQIERLKYPLTKHSFLNTDEGSEGNVVLTCSGWWKTLGWKYYEFLGGKESYEEIGIGLMAIGKGLIADTISFEANKITNLLKNPSFEGTFAADLAPFWSAYSTTGATGTRAESSDAKYGAKSQRVTKTDSTSAAFGIMSTDVYATGDYVNTISVYYKVLSYMEGAKITIRAYRASGYSAQNEHIIAPQDVGEWKKINVSYADAQSNENLSFYLFASVKPVDFIVDGAMMTNGYDSPAYFDGSFPLCTWSDVANESSSDKYESKITDTTKNLLDFSAGEVVFVSGSTSNNQAFTISTTRDVDGGGCYLSVEEAATDETAGGTITVQVAVKSAQSFQVSTTEGWLAASIRLRMKRDGTPVDNVVVSLFSDSSGVGTLLASASLPGTAISENLNWVEFSLDTTVFLEIATSYWIVVERDGTIDSTNFYKIDANEDVSYSSGVMKLWSGAAWVDRTPDADMLFQVGGVEEATAQLERMLITGAQFFSAVDIDIDSGVYSSPYRDGDTTALQSVEELLNSGTTNFRRILANVDFQRRVNLYEEPLSGSKDYYLMSDGSLRDWMKRKINKWEYPVGVWARLADVIPASADTLKISDPSKVFIEKIVFNIEEDEIYMQERDYVGLLEVG